MYDFKRWQNPAEKIVDTSQIFVFAQTMGNRSWEAGGTRGGMPGEPAGAAGLAQDIKNKSKNPKSKA